VTDGILVQVTRAACLGNLCLSLWIGDAVESAFLRMFLLKRPGKPVKNHLLSLSPSCSEAHFAAKFGKAIVPFKVMMKGP
jgi:hypothetical protein